MKPRSVLEKRIDSLAKTLKGPTQKQIEWAFSRIMPHYCLYKSRAKSCHCVTCGYTWSEESPDVCPHCGRKLTILKDSRRRRFTERKYFGVLQKVKDFTVWRIYYVFDDRKVGEGSLGSSMEEVLQHWISDNGTDTVRAKNLAMFPYYRVCPYNMDTPISLKIDRDRYGYRNTYYHINPDGVYPWKSYSTLLKRNGFQGDSKGYCWEDVMSLLLVDNSFETLWKLRMDGFIDKYLRGDPLPILENWKQVMLFHKHRYQADDVGIWLDYLSLLKYFNKDINSPHYLFPDNLAEEHDKLVKKKADIDARIELERKKSLEKEKLQILESKSKYFDITFTDGRIAVVVLRSLEDYKHEGDMQHHCVYSNSYYGKKDSLILSARLLESPTTPLETVEISLSNWKILQCYGKFNEPTEYHKQIMSLVNNNVYRFKQIN